MRGWEVQQGRDRELVALDPKLAREIDGGVHDEPTVRCRAEPGGVVCVLDGAGTQLELAVEELVEGGVVVDVWIEELVEGDLVGLDEGRDVLGALRGVVDPPFADALFTEEILDVFTALEELYLFLAAKEEVHAESSVDGHALKELFACFPVDDKVSDMVLVGEVLELRDEFMEDGMTGMGCGMDAQGYVAAVLGRISVLDELSEALRDVVIVGAGQRRMCRDLFDGFGEVVEMQEHGGW